MDASELYANASPTVRRSLERQGLVTGKRQPVEAGQQIAKASSALPGHEEQDRRNKTERAYEAEVLAPMQSRGEVVEWWFEKHKLQIGQNEQGKSCWYTPDYLVLMADGRIVFHEVKGHMGTGPGGWMDDALVKIKVAATMFGRLYGFVGAGRVPKKQGGGWKTRVFA